MSDKAINSADRYTAPHLWVQAVYHAMCLSMPRDLIIEFWSAHRTVRDSEMSLGALFEFLMSKNQTVPARYDMEVTNSLEMFLLKHGIDPEKFINFASYMSTYHPFYPSKRIFFDSTKPIIKTMATIYDPRAAVLAAMQLTVSSMLSDHVSHSIKKTGPRSHIVIFRAKHDAKYPFIHDFHFSCRIQFLNAPNIWGYPPFREWKPLSDARPIEKIMKAGETVSMNDGNLIINGKCYGETIPSFEQACADRFKLSVGKHLLKDCPVIIIDKPYRCPIRNRVVLHPGCLYDAPFYLAEVSYDVIPVEKEDYLRRMFMLLSDSETRIDIEKVHAVHASLVGKHVLVRYDAQEQHCEIVKVSGETAGNEERMLVLSRTEARIFKSILDQLIKSESSPVLVPCSDIITEVYQVTPDDDPDRYRSFYVSLKRIIDKVNRECKGLLSMKSVSMGREKTVEISRENCKVSVENRMEIPTSNSIPH